MGMRKPVKHIFFLFSYAGTASWSAGERDQVANCNPTIEKACNVKAIGDPLDTSGQSGYVQEKRLQEEVGFNSEGLARLMDDKAGFVLLIVCLGQKTLVSLARLVLFKSEKGVKIGLTG